MKVALLRALGATFRAPLVVALLTWLPFSGSNKVSPAPEHGVERTRPLRVSPKHLDKDGNIVLPGGEDEDSVADSNLEGDPYTRTSEQTQYRAYPAADVPSGAAEAARDAFAQVVAAAPSAAVKSWTSVGPNAAQYPAILGRSGTTYYASGRITALAIDPNCNATRCRLWVGAAGGGIWKTDHALATDNFGWQFMSASFASNAIGALTIDPNDATGNTLYAGTGEPNHSADSGAGVGIYKSTDGGVSWSLLAANAVIGTTSFANFPVGRAIASIVIDASRNIYVGTTSGVSGVEATSGGSGSAANNGTRAPRGIYKSTDGGANFTRIWDGGPSNIGLNQVMLDPIDPSVVYGNSSPNGIWRGTPVAGQPTYTFQQVFASRSARDIIARSQFALTVKNGHTRIYVGDGAQGAAARDPASQVWRADAIDTLTAAQLLASESAPGTVAGGWTKLTSAVADPSDPLYATYNYCTGQCWYDNFVATPPGQPDTVFVIGSFDYNTAFSSTNARAVLRSTTAGNPDPLHNNRTFTDLTADATSASTPNSIHPDQHAIVFVPGRPDVWFEGSDGGLMRSSGFYADASGQCASRRHSDGTALTAAELLGCQRLLSAIPTRFTNMNYGLNTLQFQTVSVNPINPATSFMGGTQDNGTFSYKISSLWLQTGGGDGGFSGFNAANPDHRFRSNYSQTLHGTRHGDDPASWYFISGPIAVSPESSLFYMPTVYDPNPAAAGTIFAGSQGVWRTQDDGGDPATLEVVCNSLTGGYYASCGDFEELGGPATAAPSPGDLTTSAWGASRAGGLVSTLGRSASDTKTLWAATSAGRIFISTNADAPSSVVTFTRLDSMAPNSPTRFPSGIVVDPMNPLHAWVTYDGYNANSPPSQQGHLFEVDFDGTVATWVRMDTQLGDIPITSIARDDSTGDLFLSTDFGVIRQPAGTAQWVLAGAGMPNVEVPHLTLHQGSHLLYAATHGRGAYRLVTK